MSSTLLAKFVFHYNYRMWVLLIMLSTVMVPFILFNLYISSGNNIESATITIFRSMIEN
eukprot:UN12595